MLRQLSLMPAGCQPWNRDTVAGTEQGFAYCSTLAVYVYEFQQQFGEYILTSINAEHKKTITCILWSKVFPNLIATAGTDLKICVWDVTKRKVIAQLLELNNTVKCIDWLRHQDVPKLSYIETNGPLKTWEIKTGKQSSSKNMVLSIDVTVFRWHHTKRGCVVFGHCDGSLTLYLNEKSKRFLRFSDDEDMKKDSVEDVKWDPLSDDYFISINKLSGMRLIDASSCSILMSFLLPSKALSICTFSWVYAAPGMFVTGDRESGILRLWTVGQSSPLQSIKVKKSGFSSLHVLDNNVQDNLQRSPSSNGVTPPPSPSTPTSRAQSHSVPPAHIVCTFADGGVGLYDLQWKKWQFCRDQGHIETIFDCKFKPDDPEMLATASFDGTVKVWSVNSMTPTDTTASNEGIIYSISWAPDNLNCIACGTRRRGVFVWHVDQQKIIKRFTEHGQRSVFCVAWNQRDSHRLASSSEDGSCIVRRLDGKEMKKFVHPAQVFGCAWSSFDKDLLATGCDDAIVRIWNIAENRGTTKNCLLKLSGHTKKVFHVQWHPLLDNILCSGSDDCTVRVWTIKTTGESRSSSCMSVLRGHTEPVRGLNWNYEIPYLLISGSWDSTIRLWDVCEDGQDCLEVIKDHGADVYGLTSHYRSPFLLASSSRDSTLRLWSLTSTVSWLFLKVMGKRPVSEFIATPENSMANKDGLRLAGFMSKQVIEQLNNGSWDQHITRLRWFSQLFNPSPGLQNMWDVASCALGLKESYLSASYKSGILHTKHLTKYKNSEVQKLQLSVKSQSAFGLGSQQRDQIAEKSAALDLKLGNLRRHCESLVSLGKWETALSLAPGVSMEFWKDLTSRYAKLLKDEKNEKTLSYRIALGDIDEAVEFLSSSGDYQDALLVAQSASEGNVSRCNDGVDGVSSENECQNNGHIDSLVIDCCQKLARKCTLKGDPFHAATYLLSIDDVVGAVGSLLQANELPLALCLGQCFKHKCEYTVEAIEMLSRKLESKRQYYLAVDMLRQFTEVESDSSWSLVHAICSRVVGDEISRAKVYQHAGLPSPAEFLCKAQDYEKQGNDIEAMHCYLLSTQPGKGLETGLKLLSDIVSENSWSLNELTTLNAVFCVSSDLLKASEQSRNRNKLLAISAYLGALRAIRLNFFSVIIPLFEHAIAMTERLEMMPADGIKINETPFIFHSTTIRKDLEAWKFHFGKLKLSSSERLKVVTNNNETLEKLLQKASKNEDFNFTSEIIVIGSSSPSHSDTHISSLTNTRIYGPLFYLEDDKTVISLNEAIMWFRVNQFSPTGSGERIYPF